MSDSLKDISKLKVADLKRELKVRGLSAVGNKQELQERLQIALQDDSALLLDDTGTVDTEDILNEDDVLADEDDSNTTTPAIVGSSSLKRHIDDELDEDPVTSSPAMKPSVPLTQDNGPPSKKITLNRKALSQQGATISLEKPVEGRKTLQDEETKKVVKLSDVDMKERLALRAAKFGAPVAPEAKKLLRAARFGETSSGDVKKEARAARFGTSASSVTSAGNVPEVNVDQLKKRAERFGITVGSKVDMVEMEERKKKRLERFGSSSTTPLNGSSKAVSTRSNVVPSVPKPGRLTITGPTTGKASLEEKKKMRTDRFNSNAAVSAK